MPTYTAETATAVTVRPDYDAETGCPITMVCVSWGKDFIATSYLGTLTVAKAVEIACTEMRCTGLRTVTDTGGRAYTARVLRPGHTYGRGAVWSPNPEGREYLASLGELGVTVDGAPGTWYATSMANGDSTVWLDHGQGWGLTPESSAVVHQLARDAVAIAPYLRAE